MNISPSLHSNPPQYKIEKTLFKLVSTLSSLDIIKTLSSENQLVSGLKQRRAQFKSELNTETYASLVYPKLGISNYTSKEDIEKKQASALQYAEILKKHKPDSSGKLHDYFDYFELVSVIKKVFKKHMNYNENLLCTGIAIYTDTKLYYAKVHAGKIRIITALGKPIEKGTTGTVKSVYEMASQQFVALKRANNMSFAFFNYFQTEISNLNKIHKLLSIQSTKIEGIQDPILADFNLPEHNLIGYLSPQYDIDLLAWVYAGKASSLERIKLCKSLMNIYMNIYKLGLWHGDIKLDNIMLKNNQPIVIDWAGVLLFEEAASKFISPKFGTPNYINKVDYKHLDFLQIQRDIGLKSEYIKTAKSLELFSIAMVMYAILTSEMPFNMALDPDFCFMMPKTNEGLRIAPLVAYDSDILFIMNRMLAHLPEDRYSCEEALKAWESIDPNTGKFTKKVYKLS